MSTNSRLSSMAFCALTLVLIASTLSFDMAVAHPKRKQHNEAYESNEAIENSAAFEHTQRTPTLLAASKRQQSNQAKRTPHLRIRSAPAAETILPASSSKVLECEAGGNPPPQIHWLKDGKRISQSLDEVLGLENDEDATPRGILGLSFTRSRLYLDCAQAHDAGVYTCVAENPFTRISADAQVKVINANVAEGEADNSVALCLTKKSYGSAARIHMWTRTRLEMIGSEVRLFCRSSGSPQPTISWVGPDDHPITSDNKFNIMENGDLIIKDLSWSDMGGFTCLASNQNGDDRSLTFLYPTMPEK